MGKKKKKSLLSLAKKTGKKICDATEKTCILNVELVSKNYFWLESGIQKKKKRKKKRLVCVVDLVRIFISNP